MALDGKAAKINIYVDPRPKETNPSNNTDITCKHFIEAVENSKYGFRWECPNGGDLCVYRHNLPEGYILNSKTFFEPTDERPIVDIIEEERALLEYDKCTPVTLESFNAWKLKKKEQKEKELEDKRKDEAKKTGTKGHHILSGRALFSYDANLFVDDDNAVDEDAYEIEEANEEDEEEEKTQDPKKKAKNNEESKEDKDIGSVDKNLFM
jgi:hypothetical protein